MILIFPDRGRLFERAAELFEESFREAVARRGRFAAALSGGSTPLGLYKLLAEPPRRNGLPWDKAHFFWGDERCVPPEDPQSNYGAANAALLSQVPVPAANIRRIRGEDPPREAARAYEAELRAFFGEQPDFDLVLLGLGADGHTASVFPGTSAETAEAWVDSPCVDRLGQSRVTLTIPALSAARTVLFLAAGAEKAEAVRGAMQGLNPAGKVKARGRLVWLLDSAAAAGLKESTTWK